MRLTSAQRALCLRLDRGESEPSAAEWAALRDQHLAECAPPLPPDAPRDDYPLRHLEATYTPTF